MRLHRWLVPSLLILGMASCASLPESNKAALDTAWDISYQLADRPASVVAVGTFDTQDIPEALAKTWGNDLGTNMAVAFRESGLDHKVVTRDRVDQILAEQGLEMEGMTARETQLRAGRLLGADILVTGILIWLEDDIYRASTQILETDTGVVLGGIEYDFWFDTESP